MRMPEAGCRTDLHVAPAGSRINLVSRRAFGGLGVGPGLSFATGPAGPRRLHFFGIGPGLALLPAVPPLPQAGVVAARQGDFTIDLLVPEEETHHAEQDNDHDEQ